MDVEKYREMRRALAARIAAAEIELKRMRQADRALARLVGEGHAGESVPRVPPKWGRGKLLSGRYRETLLALLREYPGESSTGIRRRLVDATGIDVCPNTVISYRHQVRSTDLDGPGRYDR